jgi:hypothetical protein
MTVSRCDTHARHAHGRRNRANIKAAVTLARNPGSMGPSFSLSRAPRAQPVRSGTHRLKSPFYLLPFLFLFIHFQPQFRDTSSSHQRAEWLRDLNLKWAQHTLPQTRFHSCSSHSGFVLSLFFITLARVWMSSPVYLILARWHSLRTRDVPDWTDGISSPPVTSGWFRLGQGENYPSLLILAPLSVQACLHSWYPTDRSPWGSHGHILRETVQYRKENGSRPTVSACSVHTH